jgi:hypothetical protein
VFARCDGPEDDILRTVRRKGREEVREGRRERERERERVIVCDAELNPSNNDKWLDSEKERSSLATEK